MGKHGKVRVGDRVSWRSHGGRAVGRITRKITGRTRAAGRTVQASRQEPQYEVQSEKSGGKAVHRPEALHEEGAGRDEPR
ncbi:DUF2945 domain-containing protein [Actinospica sp. MGRD01-02]|uniref:DUF2945 domain-containing protein n=1 Tax=Actinospica acidithermotolerans TaxID=2828514 RepID=A0A941EDF1_9ACTN|nr:DUF2945 domain-containing protein [Actinospica acidithermotolerans]MBR7829292.1 DUF2945 domain-containing protein [Actinospica acidithermotolerans]